MRCILVAAVIVTSLGCAAITAESRSLREDAGEWIACPAEHMKVERFERVGKSAVWLASGCDRTTVCSGRTIQFSELVSGTRCEETPESRERTAKKIVRDRLSLESGCEMERVIVEGASAWQTGGERAYRLDACGKRYTCTAAPGRVECRPALD